MKHWNARGYFEWMPSEDRKLLRAVDRMEKRPVQPWQAKPAVDWGKLANAHGRSILAVRSRVSLLRAGRRLAHSMDLSGVK